MHDRANERLRLYDPHNPGHQVDCCLTSGEVLQLVQQYPPPSSADSSTANGHQPSPTADAAAPGRGTGLDVPGAPECAPDPLLPGLTADDRLYGTPYGSSSGGYADYVYRVAARELYGMEVPPGPLPWRALRNADFQVGLACSRGPKQSNFRYEPLTSCRMMSARRVLTVPRASVHGAVPHLLACCAWSIRQKCCGAAGSQELHGCAWRDGQTCARRGAGAGPGAASGRRQPHAPLRPSVRLPQHPDAAATGGALPQASHTAMRRVPL